MYASFKKKEIKKNQLQKSIAKDVPSEIGCILKESRFQIFFTFGDTIESDLQVCVLIDHCFIYRFYGDFSYSIINVCLSVSFAYNISNCQSSDDFELGTLLYMNMIFYRWTSDQSFRRNFVEVNKLVFGKKTIKDKTQFTEMLTCL